MDRLRAKAAALERRHKRVRGKIRGTAARPRLCVTRTSGHIYAQVIDDLSGTTLVSASTIDREVRGAVKKHSTIEAAIFVGETVGRRSVEKGITEVVFDRGGRLYHGRVKALADGARSAGLRF